MYGACEETGFQDPIDENYHVEILFKTRDKKDKILQKLIFRSV